MTFGGIQKSSLIDFPGRLSCVIFLTGCNFRCPYCHNPDLAKGKTDPHNPITETWLMDFLEKRKDFLEGVVVSGGEPTIQEKLPAFCRQIKKMGYTVKIDTNGSRPGVIRNLIRDALVDYVAMDIKTDPAAYAPHITRNPDAAESVLASIRLLMDSQIDYEFRTTCVQPFVDSQVVDRISTLIQGARLYALQQFRDVEMLDPDFFGAGIAVYSSEDLLGFKSIAESRVDTCILRGADG